MHEGLLDFYREDTVGAQDFNGVHPARVVVHRAVEAVPARAGEIAGAVAEVAGDPIAASRSRLDGRGGNVDIAKVVVAFRPRANFRAAESMARSAEMPRFARRPAGVRACAAREVNPAC